MRKLLNTLYITKQEAYLRKDGLNLVVTINEEEVFRIPIHNIEGVVTFGYIGASPGAMQLCVENNVSLSFLSPSGRFIAHIYGRTHGNVLLRQSQYRLSNDLSFSLSLSKLFIAGKIQNYRSIIRRAIRDNGQNEALENAAQKLEWSKKKVLQVSDEDQLRGVEGDAAGYYFEVLPQLIIQQKEDFVFHGRNKRPPKDEVNVLLSFVYTLLANDVAAALETVGLDPYVGFLHKIRPGRTSLALDMMEELRAYLGDRLVLSLINRRQITKRHFIRQVDDALLLDDEGRKILITTWQERKKQELVHPFLGEKISVGLLPYAQAMLLARYLRGDIDNYPVFIIK